MRREGGVFGEDGAKAAYSARTARKSETMCVSISHAAASFATAAAMAASSSIISSLYMRSSVADVVSLSFTISKNDFGVKRPPDPKALRFD